MVPGEEITDPPPQSPALPNRIDELESRFEAHVSTTAAAIARLQAAIDILEHATGPVLDRRFERVTLRGTEAAAAVFDNLDPRLDSVIALAVHLRDSSRRSSDDLYHAVSELAAGLVLANDRVDALALILDEVAKVTTDPAIREALSTIEESMRSVISLLQTATTVRRNRPRPHSARPAPSAPSPTPAEPSSQD